jgi:pilus assembly protein CpaC
MIIADNQKKIILILTLVLIAYGHNSAFSKELPKLRGMNIEPVSIKDYPDLMDNYNSANPVKEKKIKTDDRNGFQDIGAVVGKSKFIRFDSPVKRISIANPELADLVLISPQEMLINGKQPGTTSLIIWGDSKDPVFFDLTVQSDTSAFLSEVKAIAPDEQINMTFKENNAILSGKISSNIVKDKIKSLAKAYGFEAVDLAESPSNQVLLEVKMVEASKAFNKIISSTFQHGDWGSVPTLIGEAKDTANTLKNESFDGTLNGLMFYRNLPNNNLSFFFKTAEQNGIAKILAEPQIMTTNEQEASFNAGQQVPVPSGLSETGQVAYTYKDIGVIIKFKPTILQDLKRIRMTISPEVSEIDLTASVQNKDGTIAATGFKTRKVSTTVELADGETLVIAGLYKRSNQETRTQIPLLGDIPIIGTLFKNKSIIKDETELMIFVTPKIIGNNKESRI